MRRVATCLGVMLLLARPVAAQPVSAEAKPAASAPVEEVTVEGRRVELDETARDFIMRFTKPAPAGTYALWRDPVCPVALGLTPEFNAFVARRLREVAKAVGAPVNRDYPCRPNIEIVFTDRPQAVLDALSRINPLILGYDNKDIVKFPIQAWYGTETRDNNGTPTTDDPFEPPHYVAANLTRLYTGVTAELGTVLVLADLKALAGRPIGAIADYVTLIALSQARGFDECQDVPTIANLMAPGCAVQAAALTDIDTGFLTGLYHSDTGGPEVLQRQRIIAGMKRDMASH